LVERGFVAGEPVECGVGARPQRGGHLRERRVVHLLPPDQDVAPAILGVRGEQVRSDGGVAVAAVLPLHEAGRADRLQQHPELVGGQPGELADRGKTRIGVVAEEVEDPQLGGRRDRVEQRGRVDEEVEALVDRVAFMRCLHGRLHLRPVGANAVVACTAGR
jgi:hypothetical protein